MKNNNVFENKAFEKEGKEEDRQFWFDRINERTN